MTPVLADVENLDCPRDDTSHHDAGLGCDIDYDFSADDELWSSAYGAVLADDVLVDYHMDAKDTDVISLAVFSAEMLPGEDSKHQGFVGAATTSTRLASAGNQTISVATTMTRLAIKDNRPTSVATAFVNRPSISDYLV